MTVIFATVEPYGSPQGEQPAVSATIKQNGGRKLQNAREASFHSSAARMASGELNHRVAPTSFHHQFHFSRWPDYQLKVSSPRLNKLRDPIKMLRNPGLSRHAP